MNAIRRLLVIPGALAALAAAAAGQDKGPAGRWRGEITDPVTKDVLMRAAIAAPEKPPAGERLGLLLLFHGFRGNENNYIGRTVDSLKRLGLLDRYVVISGKSRKDGWTADDDEPVLRTIAWAKERYPIDPRRVFIFGSSNGAAYVGRFGYAHQDLLAGVVGYCGGYKFPAGNSDDAAEGRTEWYFVHGGRDNPQNSRKACDELRGRGFRCIFRQMDGYGHTDIWDSGGHPDTKAADAVREDWLLWMHALRHKRIAPAAAESAAVAALAAEGATAAPDRAAALLADVARTGGPAAAKAVIAAMASPHDTVREAAAKATVSTQFGAEIVPALVRLLGDRSEAVRAAAIAGLAAAGNWRYAAAQSALAAFAADSAKPAKDRARAAAGLGRVVWLSLLGNFEDSRPVWALVRLLDDPDSAVRAAAFAALSAGTTDQFGFSPELAGADRKAALEKWQAWCTSNCGAEGRN